MSRTIANDARIPPVAVGVLARSLVARAPQGMAPLALILLVQDRTGSLAAAGLAAGAWGLGTAVGQPLWAGPASRGRAHRVVGLLALGQAAVLVLASLAPWTTVVVAVALAMGSGLLGAPVTAVARTLWPQLAPRPAATDRMFTLDATAQEVIWIAGPAVVGVVVALVGPSAALLLTGAIGGLGGLVFAAAVAPLWRPHVGAQVSAGAVALGLLLPYAAMTMMAIGLGLSEVAVPAAAIVDGQRDAAGWLLAVWSLGSLVGGLAAARFPAAGAPARRLPWLLLALAGGGVLTAAAWTLGLGWLAVVLFVAGLGLAPTLAAGYGVIAARAPDAGRTRAFAIGTTFVLVGLAAGSAVGGVLSEASPTAAFAAGAVAYLTSAGCWTLWRQRARLTRPSSQTGSADSYTLPSEPNTR